ncbi:diacylglycerol kinase family protein [Labrenzia sp. PHM005]|uniref:diacylglycerol/lipid kinase family protein n=1 Tax=Labrenzia sp. PHM005 TaxID=2590016 RepID=UPI001AD8CDCA|nr:diacylglycerol kinase family protein [Labrenzia sp. PHM005]
MNDLLQTAPDTTRTGPPSAAGTVLIMANPTSGGYNGPKLQDLKKQLEAAGRHVELRLTTHAGEIGEVCASADLTAGTLIIAGGDGSVNEALTGLHGKDFVPNLAVAPSGTANVLALELGLPHKANDIAATILNQKTRPLHYGLANGRPFVLMASAGFDAEVVHAVPLALKRKLKKLAYVITAFKIGLKRKGTPVTVSLDGADPIDGKFAVASNARHYGGPFVICPGGVTDQRLHMLVLERDDPWSSIRYSIALMLGRIHKAKGATVHPFNKAVISSQTPVAAQVDGDPFGVTPLEIRLADKTVPILAP